MMAVTVGCDCCAPEFSDYHMEGDFSCQFPINSQNESERENSPVVVMQSLLPSSYVQLSKLEMLPGILCPCVTSFKTLCSSGRAVGVHTCNPSIGRQRQADLCLQSKFQDSQG